VVALGHSTTLHFTLLHPVLPTLTAMSKTQFRCDITFDRALDPKPANFSLMSSKSLTPKLIQTALIGLRCWLIKKGLEPILNPKLTKAYDIYENDHCDRPVLGGTRKCNGKSVIRSRAKESNTSLYHSLFIGCEHWQPKERGHLTVSLDGLDPAADS
jgi:hypothetical protein